MDFAKQDITTLWGSFEVKNTRLLTKMLRQYSEKVSSLGAEAGGAVFTNVRR